MRDVNLELASALYDMAAIAGDSQRAWGYKRAAKAVLRIDRDVTPLVTSNTFKSISGIGPTTDRIARELILEGRCAFVEGAVRDSGKEKEVARLHTLRRQYLSRAAVKEIVARKGAPGRAKYRGDFQMHSIYSDGAETLESIISACLERGWSCAGVTDHSYGLSIAGGMSMDRAVEQHAEIDALNRKYDGRFRMFKGIEANIRSDGTIDMEPHEMRRFEYIVASPHSALRKSFDQTERMVAAVSQPGVAILGHPQGRVFNMRAGVLADWSKVFAVAARRQIAIEIDGSWSRQDVPYELAAQALEQGCIFALDSDAHSHVEFDFADIAIAHAKLAGIPQAKIVNYWSDKKFLDWAAGAWER
jgi:putative hydrolase